MLVGVVVPRVAAGQAAVNAELGHQQVEHRGHRHPALWGLQVAHRHSAPDALSFTEIVEGDLQHLVVALQQGQLRLDFAAVLAVLHLQVPLPLLLLPAETEGAERHARLLTGFVPDQVFEIGLLFVLVVVEAGCSGHPPGGIGSVFLLQTDQERGIGVTLQVVDKVWSLLLMMKFAEDDVIDRHPESAVLSGMNRDPLVAELRRHAEVGREDRHLRAVMACLGQVVDVGGAGHAGVGAHDSDELAVVPVGALGDVGLLAPDLRRGVRQVAVPVVEGKVDAAEQLHEAGATGKAEHRHGRDRREADQPIGTVLLDGINRRGGDDLLDLVPAGAAEAPLAAGLLIAFAALGVLDDRGPGFDRVGMLLFGGAPQIGQLATQVGVLDAQRAVEVPGKGDPPLAATRLVGRDAVFEQRVVGRL